MYTIIIIYGLVKKSVMPSFIFWITFFIRFVTKLYRKTIGIPMVTNCAPLVADLFLFVMKVHRQHQSYCNRRAVYKKR